MEPAEACPDPSRLRAFFDGSPSEVEDPAITAHLDRCARCRSLLDGWAAEPSGLGGLIPRTEPMTPPPTTLRLVMDRLRPGPAAAAAAAEEGEPPLTFLEPTDRPGGLGRIGPYEVIARVGHGGMGIVLKAVDPSLDRVVAIKVLAPALATSPAARRRFLREARAAAAVCHEHVVTIHAVDEAAGHPYLVMQYIAGKSLQEKIDREAPLGLKETLRIGMQTAAGLAAAHQQGLVHRDIKPANILLENGVERARITDFGLALAVDDARLTRSGTILGTPDYMAPEQARGEVVDHRSDLFSLGGVLYAAVTGQTPFPGESTMAVLRRVCDEAPRPVRELNPEVPKWLAALIARLMAKDPAARPKSAAEVADLLGRRLAEVQGLVPAATAGDHPRRDRRPRAGVLAAGILVGLAAIAIPAALHLRRPEAVPGPAPGLAGPPPVAPAPGSAPALPTPAGPDPAADRQAADRLQAQGWGLVAQRQLPLAFDRFSEALRLDPRCVMALLGRANVYDEWGDLKRSLADCDEAIRLAPGFAGGYDVRSKARADAGRFAEAIADASEAVRLEPERPYPYFHRGRAYHALGQWDDAITSFGETIRRVPNHAISYHLRAGSYLGKQDFDSALADAATATEMEPRNAAYRARRGLIHGWKLDPARALIDLDEAIRINPNEPAYYHDRGWAHSLRRDHDHAVADFSRALRDRPREATWLIDRASAQALGGHYREAEADFDEAMRIDGDSPTGRVRRARYLHHARGDYDRAIADCDAVLRGAPDHAEALLNRGLALLAKGEPSRALADLDRVLALNQGLSPTFEGPLSVHYPALQRARADAHARAGKAGGGGKPEKESP
ncbi:serine/threonine-protein kinase [Aquisphaera insulae]|uniref:serine/threonine-protein kinase n=1 Tax=Aquisphaera insulae TaxID=2712864 RepID=UPI0013ED3B84|nr:serine/threonine-protein kinase [Aquisphaera insulae]